MPHPVRVVVKTFWNRLCEQNRRQVCVVTNLFQDCDKQIRSVDGCSVGIDHYANVALWTCIYMYKLLSVDAQ